MMRAVAPRVGRSHGWLKSITSSTKSHTASVSVCLSHIQNNLQRRHYTPTYEPPPFKLHTYNHPTMDQKEFVKTIRKPYGLYDLTTEALKDELRTMDSLKGDPKVRELLSKDECDAYLQSMLHNFLFPKAVHNYFDKSCFGLPLFGATIYSHITAGLGNYIMKNKKDCKSIDDALRYITYYRSALLLEELRRLGYNDDQIREIVAKQFYLQYWSGKPFGPERDPLVFNPMVRSFYPCDSHISSGSTDLGRDTELQTARLFCMGVEGNDNPPVTIINAGDTTFFTDGAMHALQHIVEARERGYKMPIIFQINANNAAISARFDYGQKYGDNGDYGVERIQTRFKHWNNLIDEGFTTWAEDVSGGIQAARAACDQVLETGRPTWLVTRFPFRPGGHASDQSPAPEEMLLDQFDKFKNIVIHQLSSAAPEGTTGSDLVSMIEDTQKKIDDKVELAITGTQILSREEIRELSQPGSTTILAEEQGELVPLDVNYLLNKRQKEFAGMGSDIYGKAINNQMNIADEMGIAVRYVHQENHHKGEHDTRGGVYGELNPIAPEHMSKFVGFMPQEAQVVQVGAAYRSVLPPGNRVFVKGPHTIFNEHAKDHIRYAAYRYCDSGQHANHIYMFDGGSLAFQEKDQFVDKASGDIVTRDLFLARVGEHHNSPEYSAYAADSNTVMALPMDMNVLSNSMHEIVRLHDMGRMVIGVAPTASFGMLHAKMKLPEHKDDNITINDTIQVKIPGKNKPLNGRKLIVISWGPDCKMIAKVLAKEDLDCEMLIVNFNRVPNSLVNYLDEFALKGEEVEIICVDPNPNSALLGPVMSQVRRRLGWPEHLTFSECTISTAYVPYGLGDPLLQPNDIRRALRTRKVISGDIDTFQRKKFHRKKSNITAADGSAAGSGTTSSSGKTSESKGSSASDSGKSVTVNAPMDGEGVYVTFMKEVGDSVEIDELVAEIESDKATIEVNSPVDGFVEEFHVEEKKELNVGPDTKIVTIKGSDIQRADSFAATKSSTKSTAGSGGGVSQDVGAVQVVNAPMDGEGVYVTFMKEVGDSVEIDELVAEIESDKATIEVNAPCNGRLTEFLVKEKTELNVTSDTEIFKIQPTEGASAPSSKSSDETESFIPKVIKDDEQINFGRSATVDAKEVQPLSRFQLAMAKNMSVQVGDTYCFQLMERVDFDQVIKQSKEGGANPVALLVKSIAEAARTKSMNKKLSPDRQSMININTPVDIAVAVDAQGQLRTPVVRDVTNKSLPQIQAEIMKFVSQGAKLTPESQDLTNVCYTISTMGKDASDIVIPVLPKNTTGIIGVGKRDSEGKSFFVATICHATMTGVEGTKLMSDFVSRLNSNGA